MNTLWVICGAGKGVGKTHLAHRICGALPNSIYAKQGHGRKRKGKPDHFFDTRKKLETFIRHKRADHEHIVVESNALARSGKGDVIIFLEGTRGRTDFRKDASRLRSKAHIQVGLRTTPRNWRRVLSRRLADTDLREEIIAMLIDQQRYQGLFGLAVRSKIWMVSDGAHVFGPGLSRLLERIGRTGALTRAAADLKISYRQAWKQIKQAEDNFGSPLVLTRPGGRKGGGTELAPGGKQLLGIYKEVDKEVQRFADKHFAARMLKMYERHFKTLSRSIEEVEEELCL